MINGDNLYTKCSSSWIPLSVGEWKSQQPDAATILPMHGANINMLQDEAVYEVRHQRIQLPHGQSSILIDIGATILQNFIASNQGTPSRQFFNRTTQFNVTGVGKGAAKRGKEVQIQIAIRSAEQASAVEQYRANVAEGSWEHLPAIMGHLSMASRDSVSLLRKGLQQLVFPGPGGYRIEWSPGTKILPLKESPSGQL
eukprot:8113201-Karenia_brevis.AAC.1